MRTNKLFYLAALLFPSLSGFTQAWIDAGASGLYSLGKVGLGASTFLGQLDVQGPSTGNGISIFAGGGGDVLLNSGGSLFFDGNYSYANGNYLRPISPNTQAFFTSGAERMRVTSDGNIGIGTTAPQGKLEISGAFSGASQLIVNSTSSNAEVRFSYNNMVKGYVWYYQPIDRFALGGGSLANSIFITPSGEFGIGTQLISNPHNYKLAVNGVIGTKGIWIENKTAVWPDYVFSKKHRLSDLLEVERFVKNFRHLPEMPTAEQIGLNGQALGEISVLLLKKVEELTLYMVELNAQLECLEGELASLQNKE